MIKGVILDIGGVVLPYAELEEPHDQKWERLLNLEPGSIAKRIWSHDNAKRAGAGRMQYSEFQRWIGKELGLGSELLRQWHESQWASVEFDPLIADWIQSLRKRVRIAFLFEYVVRRPPRAKCAVWLASASRRDALGGRGHLQARPTDLPGHA
jgi:hypothetical protein